MCQAGLPLDISVVTLFFKESCAERPLISYRVFRILDFLLLFGSVPAIWLVWWHPLTLPRIYSALPIPKHPGLGGFLRSSLFPVRQTEGQRKCKHLWWLEINKKLINKTTLNRLCHGSWAVRDCILKSQTGASWGPSHHSFSACQTCTSFLLFLFLTGCKISLCSFHSEPESEKAFQTQSLSILGDYKVDCPQISFQPASEVLVSISSFWSLILSLVKCLSVVLPIGLMWFAVIENQYLGDTIQTLCDGQYLQCRLRHLGLVFFEEKNWPEKCLENY